MISVDVNKNINTYNYSTVIIYASKYPPMMQNLP